MSSAVLQMKNANVDRVFFLSRIPSLHLHFMTQAESQGYHPRYAITSIDTPNFLVSNVPKAQLSGTVGVGWQPTMDVAGPQDPGDGTSRARCHSILRKAGITFKDRVAENFALSYCESLFLIKQALELSRVPSPAGLRAGLDKLASGYDSVLTFRARFGPGRNAGVSAVRDMRFDDSCMCFKYIGGLVAVR
jgi:hypothetical protein